MPLQKGKASVATAWLVACTGVPRRRKEGRRKGAGSRGRVWSLKWEQRGPEPPDWTCTVAQRADHSPQHIIHVSPSWLPVPVLLNQAPRPSPGSLSQDTWEWGPPTCTL